MKCKNCGKEAGPRANKHVKNRRYKCSRTSISGEFLPNITVDSSISDFSDTGGYSGYSDGGGYSGDGGYSGE